MSVFYNLNKIKLNIINISYNKIKINENFSNYKIIIYIKINNIFLLKNKISNLSIFLKNSYIKSLFKIPNFFFLKGERFFCIFINDFKEFLYVVKNLENFKFYYSYKNSFSNLIMNNKILEEFNKYNNNNFYIIFILKKIIIKIIILLLFFSIFLIKYIELK
jgi:hypothetical protein